MKIEIMMDMEAIGEDDTILVQDEFGEYPDSEYVPKSAYDKLHELCGMLHGRLRAAEEVTEMGWIDARLNERMRECGIEVPE